MTEQLARRAWYSHFGRWPQNVTRFTTGAANFVYLVEDGGPHVLRMNHPEQRAVLRGSLSWIDRLAAFDLPIPRLVASGLDYDPPYVVLSYLEGQDLGAVYDSLTSEQKRALARDLWAVQRRVSSLKAPGYGYLNSLDDPGRKETWREVVAGHLARSRSWIRSCGIFDEGLVARVEAWLPRFEAHFAAVEPRAFFDDATTKNLLVHEGRLSGIVDLDWLCFGDRLYNLALIRMALLERGADTEYVDFLVEEEGLDARGRAVLDFYTLAFCVDFMGGVGMQFNKDAPPVVTDAQKAHLLNTFAALEERLLTT